VISPHPLQSRPEISQTYGLQANEMHIIKSLWRVLDSATELRNTVHCGGNCTLSCHPQDLGYCTHNTEEIGQFLTAIIEWSSDDWWTGIKEAFELVRTFTNLFYSCTFSNLFELYSKCFEMSMSINVNQKKFGVAKTAAPAN